MRREFHFTSGPLDGKAAVAQFPSEPTLEEVGRAVCDRIQEYLYAEKDERHAWYGINSSLVHYDLCVFLSHGLPEAPVKQQAHYELLGVTEFVWTNPYAEVP